MKYKAITIYTMAVICVLFTLPVVASANMLQHPAENRIAPSPFVLKVQREDQGGKGIYSYGSELFRTPELFRESRDTSSDREPRERSGDRDMRSYSEVLGPSFDVPDSVDGHTRATPWWDRRSSADPMVEDLSRMDSGPGSPGGSLGR